VAEPTDLTDTIADLAANPQTVTAGDRTVTEQKLGDVIEADKHLASKRAVSGQNASGGPRSPWNALRPARAVLPGAV
jgi:hypothetical protein